MSIPPETLTHVWSAQEFYHLAKFLAWESYFQDEYSKLIALKHSVK